MSGVLLTGATTPFGRAIIRALSTKPENGPLLALGMEEAPNFTEGKPLYRRVDLRHPRETHDLLFGLARELGVKTLIHTALHRSAADTGREVHALNVEATRALLNLAERHPTLERFVFTSSSSVYRVDPERATLLSEDDPLELSPDAPQSVRDRVEADLTVCTRMGMSRLSIAVLRASEILAPDLGSQLHDYLSSPLCLYPLGFDPMLNVLSLGDAARAVVLAARSGENGVFNVPGADTLPLTLAIRLWGRRGVPVPGPLLAPLYRVRASAFGMEFRYDLNHRRFHFSAVLDGTRAKELLGYVARERVAWPATLRRPTVSTRPEMPA